VPFEVAHDRGRDADDATARPRLRRPAVAADERGHGPVTGVPGVSALSNWLSPCPMGKSGCNTRGGAPPCVRAVLCVRRRGFNRSRRALGAWHTAPLGSGDARSVGVVQTPKWRSRRLMRVPGAEHDAVLRPAEERSDDG
jgi:hypothetical protein